MGQHRGHLTPEERARITELQDQLIDRFVEHREATAEGEEERVKELAAEIDNLLREKEDREVGDAGIGSGPPAAAMGKIGAVETVEWLPGGAAAHKPTLEASGVITVHARRRHRHFPACGKYRFTVARY